jgi:hypothetical protein
MYIFLEKCHILISVYPKIIYLNYYLHRFLECRQKEQKNIKGSHKGFDFRKAIRFLEGEFGPVTIASYGPLPIGSWYGNSQVYFWLTKRSTDIGSEDAAAYA